MAKVSGAGSPTTRPVDHVADSEPKEPGATKPGRGVGSVPDGFELHNPSSPPSGLQDWTSSHPLDSNNNDSGDPPREHYGSHRYPSDSEEARRAQDQLEAVSEAAREQARMAHREIKQEGRKDKSGDSDAPPVEHVGSHRYPSAKEALKAEQEREKIEKAAEEFRLASDAGDSDDSGSPPVEHFGSHRHAIKVAHEAEQDSNAPGIKQISGHKKKDSDQN